jgi:hypothetical protein
MGDIINIDKEPYIKSERVIKFSIYSPNPINKIELIRNNSVIDSKTLHHNEITDGSIDSDLFEDIALKHSQKKELLVFYYVRVFLSNNNMAWSSPIWLIKSV